MSDVFEEGLKKYFSSDDLAKLKSASVGICGAGGLGSNVALLLARSGIAKMRLIDFDIVESSNLNRQQFFPRHVGQPKISALAEILRELNPAISIDTIREKINPENLPQLLEGYPIWVEALDDAETKAFFVYEASRKASFVVSASGLCGCGGGLMRQKQINNILIVGDFQTGTPVAPPLAPRVTQAAAMMADAILERILRF